MTSEQAIENQKKAYEACEQAGFGYGKVGHSDCMQRVLNPQTIRGY